VNCGKGHKPEGESAVDDDACLEELAEPISAGDWPPHATEPIYPNESNPPPIPPLPGSEEEQAAGSMEVITRKKSPVLPRSTLGTASGLEADQEPSMSPAWSGSL